MKPLVQAFFRKLESILDLTGCNSPGGQIGCAVALVVLGVRLLMLQGFGYQVPYWDEWVVDAGQLFKPLREGNFDPHVLLALHNEHRIFWTRLIALGAFKVAGRWDPLFEQVFDAIAFAAIVGICVSRVIIETGKVQLSIVVSAALFLVPFSYSNLLIGFQTQFFLATLLAVSAFSLAAHGRPNLVRSLTLLLLCGASLLVNGSGIALPMVLVFTSAIRAIRDRGSRLALFPLIGGASVITLIGLHFGSPIQKPSWSEGLTALCRYFSWPEGNLLALVATPGSHQRYLPTFARQMLEGGNLSAYSVFVTFLVGFLALLTFAPAFVAILQYVIGRSQAFAAMGSAWVALCASAMALARSGESLVPPRYQDILILGLFFGAFVAGDWAHSPRRYLRWLGWSWFGGIGLALVLTAIGVVAIELPRKVAENRAATRLIRSYLEKGDVKIFENQPPNHVPWPNGEKDLAVMLSDPTVRGLLPVCLYPDSERPAYSLASRLLRGFVPLSAPIALGMGFSILYFACGRRRAPSGSEGKIPCQGT